MSKEVALPLLTGTNPRSTSGVLQSESRCFAKTVRIQDYRLLTTFLQKAVP